MVAMPESVFVGMSAVLGRYGLHQPGEFRLEDCEDGVARFVTLVNGTECFAEKLYISTGKYCKNGGFGKHCVPPHGRPFLTAYL